ncbi:MAG TPA: SAM-dependent methyltransferase, partial [Acidimicrobiales bacterium]|nr:SAM-dependent methyltransferase [Acidimicrobiales bacterium]
LYHPQGGFYSGGGGAGRRRDFLTSPEVGPLFGAVVARALDEWWAGLGRPDPFVVVEAGAGSGTLAAAVLGARPACSAALRYVLVERSDALRRAQAARLPLEPAAFVLGPVLLPDPDVGPRPRPGSGPLAAALAELPVGPFDGVILANELLDNLPFRLLERNPGGGDAGQGWSEVRVGHELNELLVPASPEAAAEGERFAPDAPAGGRIPLQHQAAAWLRSALAALHRGRVVVVDYADTTPALARRPWREWVRTYRAHGRGGHPLAELGTQDVTCEVACDQLAAVRAPVADRTQAELLLAYGMDELVEDARRTWQERAAIGDLVAVAARSRVTEAAALSDPSGLGSFRALEWVVG